MSIRSNQWRHCLSQLSRALGPKSAAAEFKWMLQAVEQQAINQPTEHRADNQRVTDALSAMVVRRVSGEPLQYILGTQPFGALTLVMRPPVLIPRPETEDWTIRLARYARPKPNKPVALLDLCTGSGCIPLLLCNLWPPGTVRAWGIDVSQDAIDLARENAKLCGHHRRTVSDECLHASAGARNTFHALLADIRDPAFVNNLKDAGLCPSFDIITSNPPYIPRHEYDNLPTSVRDYEDVRALLGDPDSCSAARNEGPSHSDRGLTFYHHIAELVAHEQDGLLASGGVVAVEVGHGQAREVEAILQREGNLANTIIWKDPWDIERVVVASR